MNTQDGVSPAGSGRDAFYLSSGRTPEDRQRRDALGGQVSAVLRDLQNGLTVKTWSDDQSPGAINIAIAESILRAPLLFADLTSNNPNVYYEVGLAHMAEVPVICFQSEGEVPAFDLADQRTIRVSFEQGRLIDEVGVRQKLQDAIRHALEDTGVPITAVGVIRLAEHRREVMEEASRLRQELGDARAEIAQLSHGQRGSKGAPSGSHSGRSATEHRFSNMAVQLARDGKLDRGTSANLSVGQDIAHLRDGIGVVVETRLAGDELTVWIVFDTGVHAAMTVTDSSPLFILPVVPPV